MKDEFDTTLICGSVPANEGDMSYFARQHDVEPILIPEMSRELSPKDIVSLWKIYRFLRHEKPVIIHTHTAKAGTLGRVAGFAYRWLTFSTLIGRPRPLYFIHTYHGHVFHSYYGRLKTAFFLTIERVLARMATDKIFVLSERQRWEINEKYRVGRAVQFEIVPLGIDLAPFENWREKRPILRVELNAPDDEILVGIVGRLTQVKNHSLFLRVAKRWQTDAEKNDLPPVRFIVIGDGDLRRNLEKEASELNLKNTVFLGERNDEDVFYPALDIVALTSFNEGTPLTLIEAMANERPVISTAVGGVVDLLGAEEASEEGNLGYTIGLRGIAVRSDNAESFFEGLKRLVKDKKLRDNFATAGASFVRQKYSKERLLADIRRLYGSFEF
ncbi:MAG: glycosyltransferase [Acidobacteriota bacterium]|nr:glycosyltransferase [Acidobacteriota bacterium]